jgi:hypothetical protein
MIPKYQKDSYVPTRLDEQCYNPDVRYYMISATEWSDTGAPRWVRSPWHTSNAMREIAVSYFMRPTNYTNIEIFSEDTLDERVYLKTKTGEFVEVTLRQMLFDRQYLCYTAAQVRKTPGYKFDWRSINEDTQVTA